MVSFAGGGGSVKGTVDQGTDRAMRPGMEPVVNSTVKMSRNG